MNKPKAVIVIQMRMGSKRLPGKALKLISGKKAIVTIIDRAKKAKEASEIVIATSNKKKDDVLERIAKKSGIKCIRDHEEDLISRLSKVLAETNADALIRITGDSPLIDPKLLDEAVRIYQKQYKKIDVVTNCVPLTYPEGFSYELFSRKAFQKLHKALRTNTERESFAVYVAEEKKKFPRKYIKNKKDTSHIRLTMDYPEDLQLIRKVSNYFTKKKKKNFGLKEIEDLFEKNPKWTLLNNDRIDKGKYPFAVGEDAKRKAR